MSTIQKKIWKKSYCQNSFEMVFNIDVNNYSGSTSLFSLFDVKYEVAD